MKESSKIRMFPLANVTKSCWVRIISIDLKDLDLVKKLESIGIVVGQEVYVDNDYTLKDIMTLVINNVTYMMRRNYMSEILVNYI